MSFHIIDLDPTSSMVLGAIIIAIGGLLLRQMRIQSKLYKEIVHAFMGEEANRFTGKPAQPGLGARMVAVESMRNDVLEIKEALGSNGKSLHKAVQEIRDTQRIMSDFTYNWFLYWNTSEGNPDNVPVFPESLRRD